MSVRLKQFLIALGCGLVALVMLGLGVWQMSVYRNQGQESLIARSQQPPVSMSQQLASGVALGSMYGLQVTLHGHYLQQPAVLVGSTPPYRVVSAFSDGSRVVPVVRGTVANLDSMIPTVPRGTISQTGILLPSETQATGTAPSGVDSQWLPGVQIERLAQQWPLGVVSGFVTLNQSDAAAQQLGAATVTFPTDASGHAQNLGYAMQWWIFAIFAVVMGVVFVRTVGRRGAAEARDGVETSESDASPAG